MDTSHDYEQTRKELFLLNNKIKDQGYVVGDDWFESKSHLFYEQKVAVDEFISKHGYKLITHGLKDHQWAVQIGKAE